MFVITKKARLAFFPDWIEIEKGQLNTNVLRSYYLLLFLKEFSGEVRSFVEGAVTPPGMPMIRNGRV